MVVNGKTRWFDVHWAKGERIPEERFSAWNSFSRVGVIEQHNPDGSPYWLIRIDADAATGIATYDWDHGLGEGDRAGLLRQGPGFPYAMRPGAKTLIIGPGGGYDVSRALASGSKDVTAVEINPLIANKIMQDVMVKENHRIYLRPEVHLHVEDGRSFVRSSTEKYQVLQATLVDTWASTAAGAFALSENNLYTSDAFYDYLSHLTDDGLLAFTRWGFEPPRESLRLVSLAMDALARLGEPNAAAHVIAVRDDATKINGWGAQDTVLISRKPFSAADLENARRLAAESRMDIVYLPGEPARQRIRRSCWPARIRTSSGTHYQYDVSPVGDDRPFFFYTVQPRDLWNFVRNANQQSADYKINRAVPLLFGLMGLSIVVTGLILVLPRLVLGSRLPKQKERDDVPVVFPVPGSRLHPGAGGADPEIRPPAGPSDLRADRDRLLHAGGERNRQLPERQGDRRRRCPAGARPGRGRRAGGDPGVCLRAAGRRGGGLVAAGQGRC